MKVGIYLPSTPVSSQRVLRFELCPTGPLETQQAALPSEVNVPSGEAAAGLL